MVAELLIFIGAFQYNPLIGVLCVITAAITAVYILRLLGKVFFGQINDIGKNLTDLSKREVLSGSILIFFIMIVGVWPFPWLELIGESVNLIVEGIN